MRVLKKFKWLLVIPAVLISVGLAVVLAAGPKPRNTAAESDTGSTILTLSAKGSYNITQADGLDVVQMEDFALTSSPGDPMLPHKIQDILLPADVLESTVELRVVSAQTRILDGTYDIKPAGLPIRGGNKSIVNGRNTGVYQSDAGFPESPVRLLACSQMRKWKFARVDFSPFQYNPVSKKLTFTESVQIEISYQHSPAALDASLMRDTVWEDIAASRFLNYTEAKDQYEIEMPVGQPEPSPATNDYVIITTNAINTNSTKLNSFVTHKTNQGYSVLVVIYETSIQGLAGQAPNNRAEKIRQWLLNNYISMGIQYVLLIGDPSPYESGEGDIPMKMCHPESNSSYQDVNQTPTDYFYADLTGNWDIDNDQLYGEWDPDGDGVGWSGDYPVTGGVDFTPEVYVGRIPVYDDTDVTDLDSILQKMIDYETAASKGWRASTLLPMGFQHSSGPYDGAQLAEQMKDDYLDPAGYSNWRMYQQGTAYASDDSIYTSEEELRGNPATPNVKNRWSGAGTPATPNDFGIVCWWAHGAATYAIVGYGTTHQDGTLMQSSYCSSLDDTHPAFVYQCSCNNGWPENNNNLQYAVLEQGGIATVGATRISWFSTSIGYGGYDGSVTNSGIGYEYVDRLVQSLAAGNALYGAKSSMSPSAHECWLMNWYDFNLYGDPSLGIGLAGNLKWEQKPDLTENGIDIRCDRDDGISRVLADDFNCTTTGPITKVVLWGSWHDDNKGAIKKIHLSIHDDDPCGPMGWSEPNNLLWSRDFGPSEFNETSYGTLIDPEWWWDPATGQPPVQPGDYQVWKYEITIDSSNQFVQQGDPCNPIIYWLDVYVELDPLAQGREFGWKTRDIADGHFKDDAVWSSDDGGNWNELRYPQGHNYHDFPPDQNSIDMAFKIITGQPGEPSYLKWSQPPVEWEEPNVYVGWDEESHDWSPNIVVADDFLCDTNRPVTAIRWWGSFLNWNQQAIPPQLPKAFYLTIWTDVPDPDPCEPDDYSHPNEIIWDNYCSCYDVKFVGWEFDPRVGTITLPKFEFYQEIDPCDYWYQPNDVNVYWLGIAAVYGDMPEDPCYPWGWETREHFFQDDAVRFFGWPEPNRSYPASQFEPIKWQEETWDLSFELISRPKIPPKPPVPHLKWSQPPIDRYIDPFEMPVYWGWDEKSYNKDLQDPCGPWRIVADDFRCLGPMPITSIHWWGSHYDWEDVSQTPPASDLPTSWHIGFWSNVPVGEADYSYPKVLLHQFTVPAARVDVNQVGTDKFCDGSVYPYDVCYQYYVDLDPCEVFWQDDFNGMTQDSIFWLSIAAVYPDPCDPPEHPWGWKTRPWSWMDDAVIFNLQTEPADGMLLEPWQITPIKDPVIHESYDVAFELDTDPNYIKWEQPYDSIRHWPHYHDESSWASEDETGWLTYSRLVADDWKCERKTAVNAVVWWGSYIGYRFTPKHEPPWMTLPVPVKPDYFELRIWTDVPDPDPCDPANYSHPNEIVWEYKAYDYDEVFVGYDKHPHTAASPNEPVFRYSVRLPDSERFKQPDVNDIYWLSVVAVYVSPRTPNYPWGWTNHKHVFNDDAVGGNWDGITWHWYELCDQCGDSEDMSFVLFTHPGPDCWNYPTFCHGDGSGGGATPPDGFVSTLDFPNYRDGFMKSYPHPIYLANVCGDYNRDGQITTLDFPEYRDNFMTSPPADCPLGGYWPP